MKLFECHNCGQQLYFENTSCVHCGYPLGFLSGLSELSALVENGENWQPLAEPDARFRFCSNHQHYTCNWLIPADQPEDLCFACELNRTIPNLDSDENKKHWREIEIAKHRLIYSLLRFGLPVEPKSKVQETGLAFDFLADEPTFRDDKKVMTGHAQGLITINIAEADPAKREQFRTQMEEPYRTLLGHFRHEIGHYYWERLVRSDSETLEEVRRLFGDDTEDYGDALESHYAEGPPPNWNEQYVSTYATAHAWEDWAETWAHYMHIVDTLETAYAFGMRLSPQAGDVESHTVALYFDPYLQNDFTKIMNAWFPLTYALNSINRSMGHADLYPFVLPPKAMEKLKLIHQIIQKQPKK